MTRLLILAYVFLDRNGASPRKPLQSGKMDTKTTATDIDDAQKSTTLKNYIPENQSVCFLLDKTWPPPCRSSRETPELRTPRRRIVQSWPGTAAQVLELPIDDQHHEAS